MASSTVVTANAVPSVFTVKIQKKVGILELHPKGIKFKPSVKSNSGNKDTPFMILAKWHDIAEQQVSSRQSKKALIRLLRKDGRAPIIIEFPSSLPDSKTSFDQRDVAKGIIMHKIDANFSSMDTNTSTTSSSSNPNPSVLRLRAAILASHPSLKDQHTEMVDTGLISEEDFWSSRRQVVATEESKRQRAAKTTQLLTDLAATQEPGEKVIKYNLNAEVIHQIFVQYPAVYKAWVAQVPEKMNEADFWSLFFKSKFFHRDRKSSGHDDLFTKFEEKEQVGKGHHRANVLDVRSVVDPLVDLVTTQEGQIIHPVVNKADSLSEKQRSSDFSKFNRHAAYVLDSSQPGQFETLKGISSASSVLRKTSARVVALRLKASTELDDLKTPEPKPFIDLNLDDPTLYFKKTNEDSSARTSTASSNTKATAASLDSSVPLLPSTSDSHRTLNQLESLISAQQETSTTTSSSSKLLMTVEDNLPAEFKSTIYNLFNSVCELLRFFYAFSLKKCKTVEEVSKLDRIVAKMEEKYDELRRIRSSLPNDQRSLLAPLLKPFDDQLNHAFVSREADATTEKNSKRQRVVY